MAKLFGLNKPNTNLRKNVFDLSERQLFTTSAGLLTPVFCKELNPGEKVQVNLTASTRSLPVNTAAYVRNRQYYHYFFVPFRQLWSGWDNFINSVDYKTSSFQKDAVYSRVPALDLFSCIADLLEEGYLTPAYNKSTKKIVVDGSATIRNLGTSYRGVGRSAFGKSIDVSTRAEADSNSGNVVNININLDKDDFYRQNLLRGFKNISSVSDVFDFDGLDENTYPREDSANGFIYEHKKLSGTALSFGDNLLIESPYREVKFFDGERWHPVYDADRILALNGNGSVYYYYIGSVDGRTKNYSWWSPTNTEGVTDEQSLSALKGYMFNSKILNDRFGLSLNYNKYLESLDNPTASNSVVSGKSIVFPEADVIKTLDEQGYGYIMGISRLLDMLGYGFSYVDVDGNGIRQVSSTLVDLIDSLTNKNIDVVSWLRSEGNKTAVNPFRLLAYQKIYNDFYKRDDYEATNPLHWNIDDFKRGSAVMDFNGDRSRLLNMLRLRYRWHAKDYFTGVVPSELLGGLQGITSNALGLYGDDFRLGSDDNKVYQESGNNAPVSTKGIRAMFALEKLQRLTRRAGGFDYISQTLAHYGFEPPKGRGDKVEFVGGVASNIHITDVVTTADTEQSSAGRIAGYGIGRTDERGDTEFTAKEHGIFMCITSIAPDVDYSAEGMNSFNTKLQRGDYFQPEFQDLGLQPVFNYELYNRLYSPNVAEKDRINRGVLGLYLAILSIKQVMISCMENLGMVGAYLLGLVFLMLWIQTME